MEKRGTDVSLSREQIVLLNQLITSLEQAEPKLEEYYKKKDYENFNNSRKLIESVINKISEVLK
tara:strand:+ start:417 stop:608 length:192 start_codon:yes stop_codon:yes gene_type:complete